MTQNKAEPFQIYFLWLYNSGDYMLKNNIEKISALAIEFVFYSFIGWLYETILTTAVWGHFADRGMLHLPICPIYGFCALILIFIFSKLKNVPLIFILGTLLTTAAELLASYVLEFFTDKRLWDYDNWHFNFQGRIALGSSLIFGTLCVILIKLLHPFAVKICEKIRGKVLEIIAFVLLFLIIGDFLWVIL